MAALDAPDSVAPEPAEQVIAGRFGSPLQTAQKIKHKPEQSAVPEEFYRNFDNAIAAKRSRGGKSA